MEHGSRDVVNFPSQHGNFPLEWTFETKDIQLVSPVVELQSSHGVHQRRPSHKPPFSHGYHGFPIEKWWFWGHTLATWPFRRCNICNFWPLTRCDACVNARSLHNIYQHSPRHFTKISTSFAQDLHTFSWSSGKSRHVAKSRTGVGRMACRCLHCCLVVGLPRNVQRTSGNIATLSMGELKN